MISEKEYRTALDAVERGDKKTKTKLAWYELSGHGDDDNNLSNAIALLEERVKEGDTEAMWILGLCNEFGIGIERDKKQAELLYCQSKDGRNEIGKILEEQWKWYERGSGYLKIQRL